MYQRSIIVGALASLMFIHGLGTSPLQKAVAQPPAPPESIQPVDGADYDVLMHGVVHEAFVTPADEDLEPVIVPQRPPEPIAEEAPDVKPDGNNVMWIPGYWAWEIIQEAQDGMEEQRGFVWVSGLWRDVPPDRTWLPGEWVEVAGGFQWSPGFWQLIVEEAQPVQQQTVYLPNPPASLDHGPNLPSPGNDCFWIPGQWRFRHGSYVWTPGFWARQQIGWVWTPSRYICTPRGHLYIPGYWDYEPVTRGQLFGVVVFRRPVYRSVSFRYCPAYAISSQHLMTHLFVGSRGRFYYGNHYTTFYSSRGYRPWYECSHRRHASPIISYYRWQDIRRGRDFDSHMKQMRMSVQVSFGNQRTFADARRHAKSRGGDHHHAHPITTVADVRKLQEERRTSGKNGTRPGGHNIHRDAGQAVLAGKSPQGTRSGDAKSGAAPDKSTRPGPRTRSTRPGQLATSKAGPTSKANPKSQASSQTTSRPSRLDSLRTTSSALAGPAGKTNLSDKTNTSKTAKTIKPSRTASPSATSGLSQLRSRATNTPSSGTSNKATVAKPTLRSTTAKSPAAKPTNTRNVPRPTVTRTAPKLTSPAVSKPRPTVTAPKINRPTTGTPSVKTRSTGSIRSNSSTPTRMRVAPTPRPSVTAPKINRPTTRTPSVKTRSTSSIRSNSSTPTRTRVAPTPRPSVSKSSRPSTTRSPRPTRATRNTMSRSNRGKKDKK